MKKYKEQIFNETNDNEEKLSSDIEFVYKKLIKICRENDLSSIKAEKLVTAVLNLFNVLLSTKMDIQTQKYFETFLRQLYKKIS